MSCKSTAPPAELVHQEVDRFAVRTAEPAVVTIRFEYTDKLVVDGSACLEQSPSGAIIAHLPAAGTYQLEIDPGRALPGIGAETCPAPTSDPTSGGVTELLDLRPESVSYE